MEDDFSRPSTMEGKGLERDTVDLASNGTPPHLNGAHQQDSLLPQQPDLVVEIDGLQPEVELPEERREAFRRVPRLDKTGVDEDTETKRSDASDTGNPRNPGSVFRRRAVTLALALIAIALLCVGALRFWNYLQSYEWTDDAEIEGHLDPVSTRINDTVIHVYVENTYHVKQRQVLVDLDPRDYQVAVENAAANLAEAQQGLGAARQSYNFSVANLAAAVATNAKAQLDVKRYGELFKHSVISSELNDNILMTGRVDAAQVDSDRAGVTAMERMIGQAEAAVQAAQASLDQAKLNLSYTHIVAPASGVVGDKTVQVGQRVQPGEQLLTIVPLDDIWITADFRETQVRRMRRGELVTVHVDATGKDYKGYIEGMPGASGELFSLLPPENATGNYVKVVQRLPVRIRLYPGQDPRHRLRPGMSVEPIVWVGRYGRPRDSGATRQ
jgi:membrane fusion protein, multidrug efflux system